MVFKNLGIIVHCMKVARGLMPYKAFDEVSEAAGVQAVIALAFYYGNSTIASSVSAGVSKSYMRISYTLCFNIFHFRK